MPNEKDKPVVKVVDSFKDVKLDLPILEMDLSEDAWEYGAPPPAGVYTFSLFMAKDGRELCYSKEGDASTAYAKITVEMRVADEGEWKDAVAFYRADSRIFRGKKISSMAGLLVKLYGEEKLKKVGGLDHVKQAILLENALKQEPKLKAELDWRGAYKWTDKQGNDHWENVANSYKDFPVDPEDKSKRLHIFEVTGKGGDKVEVRAQTQVGRFFAKGETPQAKRVVGIGKITPPKEEDLDFATPTIAKASAAVVASPVSKDDEESMGLMLE